MLTGEPKRTDIMSVAANDREYRSSSPMAGFTLIEVLLAILIFGIMMTSLFGAFHLQFSNAEAVGENMKAYEGAQICLSRMAADLQSLTLTENGLYDPVAANDQPDVYRVQGDVTESAGGSLARLRFASRGHTPIATRMPGGIGEIVYYLDPLENGRYFLRRADYNVFEAPEEVDGLDPVLCDDVSSLKFVYYDQDGEGHDTWSSDSEDVGYATPRAIRIELAIGNPEQPDRFQSLVYLPVFRDKIVEEP
jgi:general secretion pathway protein J